METISKVIERVKEARKEKGFSHENMAVELDISQAAYTNLEKNESKLTVERLIKISEILEKPVYYFFDSTPSSIFNQKNCETAVGHIEHLYQDNKDTYVRLEGVYEDYIKKLNDEIIFLRGLVEKT